MTDGDNGRPAALAAIGGTPIVRLSRLVGPDAAEVWVKLEGANRPAPTRTGWRSR